MLGEFLSDKVKNIIYLGLTLAAAGFFVQSAHAQDERLEYEADADAIEIGRSADLLGLHIRPQRPDRDRIESVMVFTNASARDTVVLCRAFDHNGVRQGSYRIEVPGHGLRFILASDISGGADFIGKAGCVARGHLLASGYLLAENITSIAVHQENNLGHSRMGFPMVVTY